MPENEEIITVANWGGGVLLPPDEGKGVGMRLIRRAVLNGWKIPERAKEVLPAMVLEIAESSPSQRDRIRAVELLNSLEKSNVEASEKLDKMERLESGQPTDIQRQQVFKVEFDD